MNIENTDYVKNNQEFQNMRLPPYAIEAEQAVIGSLLIDNEAWDKIADVISDQDFYRHEHKILFKAIGKMAINNQPADMITICDTLLSTEELDIAGGREYIELLVNNTPSSANVKPYAEIVREKSILRSLSQVGTEIVESVHQTMGKTAAELLDLAESKVFRIAESSLKASQGFLNMSLVLKELIHRIEDLYKNKAVNDVTGVSTGFVDLDKMTAGLQGGDLIIVAGRPSMGKTAFAMNIAEHVAIQQKKAVAVFSIEMSGSQLVMRMVSSISRLDQHKLKTGQLIDNDWARLTVGMSKISESKFYIDETPGLTVLELRARARRFAKQAQGNAGLIVIDYLQLMSGSSKDQNRATELGEISRSLKALARELKVPVVALSQLSRSVEQRSDKRPMMSDLRESGAIEQDADLILFMYRDEYYNPESAQKGMAEVIIGKQRNGPTGKVALTFLGHYSRFENAATDSNSWAAEKSPPPTNVPF